MIVITGHILLLSVLAHVISFNRWMLEGYQKITDFWFYLLLFLVMLNCSTVLMLTMQVETVAIYCICCIVCVFGCISWSIDSRCAGKIWSFSLDRSCRCSAVCVCLNQVICLIFIRFFCLIDHAGKGDCCIKVFYFLKGNFYALFSGWALLFVYLSSLPSPFFPPGCWHLFSAILVLE